MATDNLVLEMLRAIRGDIAGVKEELVGLKQRTQAVETAVVSVKRDTTEIYAAQVVSGQRLDKLSERMERIERRLDIVES